MIALVGAGNVATWIARRLRNNVDFPVCRVYSRSLSNAHVLANMVGAEPIDDIHALNPHCDAYLLALRDDCYQEVLPQIPFKMNLALLTAGTLSQNILAPYAQRYGVVYPLQTFSKNMSFHDLNVPLCIESSQLMEQKTSVYHLAGILSDEVYEVDENKRFTLHLAAVFASNFSNAMVAIAAQILHDKGLSLKMLYPLLQNTAAKWQSMSPADAQTGPARRNDLNVMQRHLEELNDEELKKIYQLVSEYIRKHS